MRVEMLYNGAMLFVAPALRDDVAVRLLAVVRVAA